MIGKPAIQADGQQTSQPPSKQGGSQANQHVLHNNPCKQSADPFRISGQDAERLKFSKI